MSDVCLTVAVSVVHITDDQLGRGLQPNQWSHNERHQSSNERLNLNEKKLIEKCNKSPAKQKFSASLTSYADGGEGETETERALQPTLASEMSP